MGKGKRRYNRGRKHNFELYMLQHAGWDGDFYDSEEAHYWRMMRGNPAFGGDVHSFGVYRRDIPPRPKVNGFKRKELAEFLKDMHQGLRHKEEEILNSLEKLKILEPVDYYSDVVLPEEAVDIFTTDIPEIVDDALSIEQIIKWLGDDVKKIWAGLVLGKEVTRESREEAIDWAKFVVETYRKGLKSLRRKVRAELEERELQKEVKFYHEQGLDILMEDFFDDEGLINALESNGIRYLFQLIFKSRTEVKEFQGIGATRMERIDQKLEEFGLQFMGKEPEKKKKSKKKETIEAQVVDITKK